MNNLLSCICFLVCNILCGQKITIIGAGQVGLVTATFFAHKGHTVFCVDTDEERIEKLKSNNVYLYEPGLQKLLFNCGITFTTDLSDAKNTEFFFICVGTPTDSAGACDCSILRNAFYDLVALCDSNSKKIICIKSTVPPGTMQSLKKYLLDHNKHTIGLIYNPEFMRTGSAIKDLKKNNPLVLGSECAQTVQEIEKLYNATFGPNIKTMKTNFETAEIIKYAWNSFSAIRIAYANELALLCRAFKGDIKQIMECLALSEQLLPTRNIKSGPGYGGSCLPKDAKAFSHVLDTIGLSSSMVHQAIRSNENHIERLTQNLLDLLGSFRRKKIVTILGLSFKANTNDVRGSPAIPLIQTLTDRGVAIKAYDPKAIPNMKKIFPTIQYFNSPYEAIEDSDCIVVLTGWKEIKELDLEKVTRLCNKKLLIDTRDLFDRDLLEKYEFTYLKMR